MRKSLELKNQLGGMVAEYRQTMENPANKVDGKLNADTKAKLERMDAAMDDLQAEIATHEKLEAREEKQGGRNSSNRSGDPDQTQGSGSDNIRATPEYQQAFSGALATGRVGSGFSTAVRNALQADLDDQGGVLVASEQFSDQFIQALDNEVFMRGEGMATITRITTAASLGIPTLASDVDDANWTAEIQTGAADTGMKFGKRALHPHPLAKRITLSKKLLRLVPKVEGKVMERLAYKFGVAMENGYLTGNGNNQPLGVFTPSLNGISTARDITAAATTSFTSDNLMDVMYNVKGQYMRNGKWIFSRPAVKMVRKMKDGEGRYIWQPGLTLGQPASILDRPFMMSEFAPSALTTGTYAGIFGDFSKYEIVDALDMTVQVLTELYAESNQNGYIGRLETDGMPVLEEAFSRLILA